MQRSRIYTLGTSNRTLEEFFEIIRHYKIKNIIDVRRFPISKRFPHFKKQIIKKEAEREDIKYFWLGNLLGGYRKGGYMLYSQTNSYLEGIKRLEVIAISDSSVIICAERLPWRCHRLSIAQSLQERGWDVIHILEKERVWKTL